MRESYQEKHTLHSYAPAVRSREMVLRAQTAYSFGSDPQALDATKVGKEPRDADRSNDESSSKCLELGSVLKGACSALIVSTGAG